MKTHEASENDRAQVDFCWENGYRQFMTCYSDVHINGSAFQAWRAGFREGVKMCLNKGARPTVAEFQDRVHQRNLDNLTIWHNIGADVNNGHWAMAGARQGTYMTMLTNWDYREVQDFDALASIWTTVEDSDPRLLAGRVADDLHSQLDLPMMIFEGEQSRFFK